MPGTGWTRIRGKRNMSLMPNRRNERTSSDEGQVPTIHCVQKTVEVPEVQYIDKVADIPVDVQRQMSTTQGSQHDMQQIDEVVHATAFMESEVPTIGRSVLQRDCRRRPA